MAITQKQIKKIAKAIRDIADDLELVGPDDWESFEDCMQGTLNNLALDLNELKTEE